MADIKTLQEVLLRIKQVQERWDDWPHPNLALQDAYASVNSMIIEEREKALTELVQLSEELGLYDDLKEPNNK